MFKIGVLCFWIVFGKVAIQWLAYMHASYVRMHVHGGLCSYPCPVISNTTA